jgi:hypothetical protein
MVSECCKRLEDFSTQSFGMGCWMISTVGAQYIVEMNLSGILYQQRLVAPSALFTTIFYDRP